MAAAQEIGWQPTADEGLRLMTSTDYLAGLRATLTLPTKYGSPNAYSYFNFYLGINYPGGGAVEAGISYGWKEGVLGWRIFTNPGITRLIGSPPQTIDLALYIKDHGKGAGFPVCYFGGYGSAASSAWGKCGKVKMVAAMHEDIGDAYRRKTWFDQMIFKCTGVIDRPQPGDSTPATVNWLPFNTIPKLKWHLQRPDSSFRMMQAPGFTGDYYRVIMYEPGLKVWDFGEKFHFKKVVA